ncbi:rhomboid family intramembrane serine protease [archaeon]|nr:MAG: rhomboid family intramembrane serine protease [archaeon]
MVSMMFSTILAPRYVTVGASGALFGVVGAMFAEWCQNWHLLPPGKRLLAFVSTFFSILLNIAIGLLPVRRHTTYSARRERAATSHPAHLTTPTPLQFIDNFAHIFGCLSGFLMGSLLIVRRDVDARVRRRQVHLAWAALAGLLILVGLAALAMGRRQDANDFCSWCRYLSCVPSPLWTCGA